MFTMNIIQHGGTTWLNKTVWMNLRNIKIDSIRLSRLIVTKWYERQNPICFFPPLAALIVLKPDVLETSGIPNKVVRPRRNVLSSHSSG